MEYSPALAKVVDSRIEIESGSEMEVEIRANMIWATELMCRELAKNGVKISPIELDSVLWVMSQSKSKNDKPYHLTLTVDY